MPRFLATDALLNENLEKRLSKWQCEAHGVPSILGSRLGQPDPAYIFLLAAFKIQKKKVRLVGSTFLIFWYVPESVRERQLVHLSSSLLLAAVNAAQKEIASGKQFSDSSSNLWTRPAASWERFASYWIHPSRAAHPVEAHRKIYFFADNRKELLPWLNVRSSRVYRGERATQSKSDLWNQGRWTSSNLQNDDVMVDCRTLLLYLSRLMLGPCSRFCRG